MNRLILVAVVAFGVPAVGLAQQTVGNGMRMGLAKIQPDGQLHLRIPSAERPQQVDVDVIVGATVQKMHMRRATTSETEVWLDPRAVEAVVEAVDADGKAIAPKDLTKLLENETPVVMFVGREKPDPQHLKLFKKGTVILHVPVMIFGGHFESPAVPGPPG